MNGPGEPSVNGPVGSTAVAVEMHCSAVAVTSVA